jgi:hypothetical protein
MNVKRRFGASFLRVGLLELGRGIRGLTPRQFAENGALPLGPLFLEQSIPRYMICTIC